MSQCWREGTTHCERSWYDSRYTVRVAKLHSADGVHGCLTSRSLRRRGCVRRSSTCLGYGQSLRRQGIDSRCSVPELLMYGIVVGYRTARRWLQHGIATRTSTHGYVSIRPIIIIRSSCSTHQPAWQDFDQSLTLCAQHVPKQSYILQSSTRVANQYHSDNFSNRCPALVRYG
jgi:hypothetical protein